MNEDRATRDCRHQLLSRGRRHPISLCTCGTVHVTMANTTLRFAHADFDELAASVARRFQRAKQSGWNGVEMNLD